MYAENNCAEVVLNKHRCLLRGYHFLSNRGHKNAGGHRFFFCEKHWGLNLKLSRDYWVVTNFIEICVQ